MRYPFERVLLYFILNDTPFSAIKSYFERIGVSSPSNNELENLANIRTEIPHPFKPWDITHKPSQSWLNNYHLANMWHSSEDIMEAWKIFSTHEMRLIVEMMLLCQMQIETIESRLRQVGKGKITGLALTLYRYYFFDLSLLLDKDRQKYLEMNGLSEQGIGANDIQPKQNADSIYAENYRRWKTDHVT